MLVTNERVPVRAPDINEHIFNLQVTRPLRVFI